MKLLKKSGNNNGAWMPKWCFG